MQKKILLVEYDDSVINTIKDILGSQIFEITVASDGESAQKLLKKNKFNMVITEAMLPRFHGFNLVQLITDKYPEIKIVMISGIYKGIAFRQKAIQEYRVDDFFEKPIDREPFLSKIIEILNLKREDLINRIDTSTSRYRIMNTSKPNTTKMPAMDVKDIKKIPSYKIDLDDKEDKENK